MGSHIGNPKAMPPVNFRRLPGELHSVAKQASFNIALPRDFCGFGSNVGRFWEAKMDAEIDFPGIFFDVFFECVVALILHCFFEAQNLKNHEKPLFFQWFLLIFHKIAIFEKITKKLWEDNYEIALLSLNTKFVQGLKNGSLPKNIFQEYLAQDYFFLETFAKAYGLAISKSKDKFSIRKLSELLMGVSEELILHETYAKEWDIDLSNNYIKKATKNYTDFLDDTSKRLSSVEIMFAMTPCMRLYSWIGKSLYEEDFDIKYKEWIITYSDESFEKLADSLENLIETNKETYDINQAKYLYRRAMELELDFFNAYSDF